MPPEVTRTELLEWTVKTVAQQCRGEGTHRKGRELQGRLHQGHQVLSLELSRYR